MSSNRSTTSCSSPPRFGMFDVQKTTVGLILSSAFSARSLSWIDRTANPTCLHAILRAGRCLARRQRSAPVGDFVRACIGHAANLPSPGPRWKANPDQRYPEQDLKMAWSSRPAASPRQRSLSSFSGGSADGSKTGAIRGFPAFEGCGPAASARHPKSRARRRHSAPADHAGSCRRDKQA